MRGDYDEEGEPVYDPDAPMSREGSPEEEEWQDSPSASPAREVSPKAKPRKRLVKKTNIDDELEDDDRPRKRKSRDSEDGEGRQRVRKSKEGREGKGDGKRGKASGSIASKLSKLAKGDGGSKSEGRSGRSGSDRPQRNRDRREEKETWGRNESPEGDSEEDKELEPTPADDNFIDDTGVEHEGYSDDGGASPSHAPQAEEAEEDDEKDELNKFFKSGKKKKNKNERSWEEIAMFVEQFMAKLDVAAEADADLNRASKPAIEKLKMLPELLTVLEKRQLQQEFLDRGVLSSLKNWLEPLPDGSLPNMNIRSALLKLLTDLPIDVEVVERREQLKKSGLGKVVMFLSRLSEETPGNKKLARDLVDKWSRPIFQKSTRYEDLKQYDDERPPPRRLQQPAKKPVAKPLDDSRGGDELDMENDSGELKPGDPGYRYHASRPQAMPLDFVVRPASRVDAEDVRARAKQLRMDEKRAKMNKKLQLLRTPKRKNLQAARLSVEGRGVVSYH